MAFRTTNTIYQQLSQKGTTNNNPSRIYQLKCNTCKEVYVGQSGRSITTRYKEHIRYKRYNNPTSAYAMHILNNRHEFGPAEKTLKLVKPCTKGTRMNCWKTLYMHLHHKRSTLISEQQVNDTNPRSTWHTYHVTYNTSRSSVLIRPPQRVYTPTQQGKSSFTHTYV